MSFTSPTGRLKENSAFSGGQDAFWACF